MDTGLKEKESHTVVRIRKETWQEMKAEAAATKRTIKSVIEIAWEAYKGRGK